MGFRLGGWADSIVSSMVLVAGTAACVICLSSSHSLDDWQNYWHRPSSNTGVFTTAAFAIGCDNFQCPGHTCHVTNSSDRLACFDGTGHISGEMREGGTQADVCMNTGAFST